MTLDKIVKQFFLATSTALSLLFGRELPAQDLSNTLIMFNIYRWSNPDDMYLISPDGTNLKSIRTYYSGGGEYIFSRREKDCICRK